MIIYLYGDLRFSQSTKISDPPKPIKLRIRKDDSIKTIADILNKLNIQKELISHIFVNGKYCGYGKKILSNDRIGLFPRNMALNFAEIEKNNPISVQVNISDEISHKMDESVFEIKVPEGSNIDYLLNKIHIQDVLSNLNIQLNGNSIKNIQETIHNNDLIYINRKSSTIDE
ncbi:MAG: hypothetical protein GF317_19845 [Candidatus Lokiarchaeota archaeon]|nr:hypothetical protein [Candidatus Lokiarchaeota archaeon]MBD3201746.1 hypothetical protein [Candidatus Lokiarchaeota archaeon]